MAPSLAPAPTTVCSSSMNRMMLPVRVGDLLEHRLQPLLELAAVLGPGDERAEVEPHDPLVPQAVGDVAADDPLGQPFGDRRLADARLADEDRVVLRPPAEHLDDAADLLVAADDRVERALRRLGGQVAAVLRQGLVGRLGVLARHALAPSDGGQCLQDRCLLNPRLAQDACRAAVAGLDGGDQQVLGGDVLVAHPLGDGVGIGQDAASLVRELELLCGAGDLRQLRQLGPQRLGDGGRRHADPVEHRRHDAVGLLGQDEEEVRRLELGVALGLGELLRRDDRLGRALGESIGPHSATSLADSAAESMPGSARAPREPARRPSAARHGWSRSGRPSATSRASAGRGP